MKSKLLNEETKDKKLSKKKRRDRRNKRRFLISGIPFQIVDGFLKEKCIIKKQTHNPKLKPMKDKEK